MDFSLQQNKKYTECGDPDPDRDPQFKYIASESARLLGNGLPAIPVNAKKEVGNFENDGAEYRLKGILRLVNNYDFCDKKAPSCWIYASAATRASSTSGSADTS